MDVVVQDGEVVWGLRREGFCRGLKRRFNSIPYILEKRNMARHDKGRRRGINLLSDS